jgi:hypothetical protein
MGADGLPGGRVDGDVTHAWILSGDLAANDNWIAAS